MLSAEPSVSMLSAEPSVSNLIQMFQKSPYSENLQILWFSIVVIIKCQKVSNFDKDGILWLIDFTSQNLAILNDQVKDLWLFIF